MKETLESRLTKIALKDAGVVAKKDAEYGSSWKRRGGVGAFMQGIARKWDRIENMASAHGYDIFAACMNNGLSSEDLMDTIRDLRGYLLLIEDEVEQRKTRRELQHEQELTEEAVHKKAMAKGKPAMGVLEGRAEHPAPFGYVPEHVVEEQQPREAVRVKEH